jgi:hypothetical protein
MGPGKAEREKAEEEAQKAEEAAARATARAAALRAEAARAAAAAAAEEDDDDDDEDDDDESEEEEYEAGEQIKDEELEGDLSELSTYTETDATAPLQSVLITMPTPTAPAEAQSTLESVAYQCTKYVSCASFSIDLF